MKPMKSIRDAENFRDRMLMYSTSGDRRMDLGYETYSDSVRDVDKVKGFASVEYMIKKEDEKKFLALANKFLDETEAEREEKGLLYQYGKAALDDDPNLELFVFVVELNKGDYDKFTNPLSKQEEAAIDMIEEMKAKVGPDGNINKIWYDEDDTPRRHY